MFIVLHFPFVDLRGLHDGALGRSPKPTWQADNPGECFIRNFGGMVPRNAKAYGLVGERAYVEFAQALAFPKPGSHHQEGWPGSVPLRLWFRRLYFDGDISGRFEIGFNTETQSEESLFEKAAFSYEPSLLARSVSDISAEVRSPDGSRAITTLEKCGENLGLAYLTSTTLHSKANNYPAYELLGKLFKVGAASIHIRTNNNIPFIIPQDRRDIVSEGGDHMFLCSIDKSQRRNTITVQISRPHSPELPSERARRVLFAHLNSILHANDFLAGTMDAKAIAQHRVSLKDLTERTMGRFRKLTADKPMSAYDIAFDEALKAFADDNAGRIDEIVAKLQEISVDASAPSRLDKVGTWIRGWVEFVTNSAIEAGVNATISPR